MEYTFRNSSRGGPCTILLSEFSLTVKCGPEERVIPYASITEVQIEKKSNKVFRTRLYPDSGKSIEITNQYASGKDTVDTSRAYATFVRVLHFHLKDKSKADFISGKRTSQLWMLALLVVSFCFAISFVTAYLEIGVVNPFLQGAVLSICAGAFILVSNFSNWPRPYLPGNIPLDFLP